MAFLKEPVLSALNRAGRPLKAKELARELEVTGSDYRAFRTFLRELQANGELYRVKGGRYAPPDRINLVVGHLTLIRSGAAFLVSEKPGEDDVFVPADELGNAYHRDKVVVRVEKHRRRGRPEGRVVRVLERARSEFVGTVRLGKHVITVNPDDPKFPRDIYVPAGEGAGARDGEKVMVEVLDWGTATSGPVGRISEVLGMPGDPGLDVLIIIKHNGLPTEFPEAVEAAARALPDAIPAEEAATRTDFRGVTVVTIDPVNAKDFDDALSLTATGDGNLELGVHIADVSHYVRFGTALDKEARHRGTSVYLVDRVLPMLPEKISNHLCSLNPGVDRLAMSVIMTMTPKGKMLDYRIDDTVIRSSRRLAYEQVQGYFDGDPELRKEREVAALLDRLRSLAAALHEARNRRGALDFDLPSSRVELDPDGLPVDIHKVVRLESHRLVEEFMLLANETVARHLKTVKADTLYRVHEDPKEEKLEELQTIIARFGYSLNVDADGRVPPRELQRVLAACEGKPEELIVNTLVLRSLARARYDPLPLGHYGLALRDYLHFTSPIRRYPDLVVHRTLRVLSKRQPPPMRDIARYREWVGDTAVRSSERERLAEEAERDSVELKKIQFMERHLGDVFEGIITSVEVFGFFVELTRYHVSGLVHLSTLDDDYYEYDEDEYRLVGSNTGRTFTLGDPVTVNVLSVSKELRQIDFLLDDASEPAAATPGRQLRKARRDFEGGGKAGRPAPRPESRRKGKRGALSSARKNASGRGSRRGKRGRG